MFKNKAEGGFSLLAWAAKPSETRVGHRGGGVINPSTNIDHYCLTLVMR